MQSRFEVLVVLVVCSGVLAAPFMSLVLLAWRSRRAADLLARLGEAALVVARELARWLARGLRARLAGLGRLARDRWSRAPVAQLGPPAGYRLAALTEGAALRCPYCHDDLGGALLTCEGCATTFHDECARGLRRCTTLGCGGRAELAAPVAGLRIQARRRQVAS